MSSRFDELASSLDRLEQSSRVAAAGRKGEWAEEIRKRLEEMCQTWLRHASDTETPNGLFSEIDWTRPALVRQVGELRGDHEELFSLMMGLREDLRKLECAELGPEADGENMVGPDVGSLELRVRQLVDRLRHHREHETDLVQESITTDLGAGD